MSDMRLEELPCHVTVPLETTSELASDCALSNVKLFCLSKDILVEIFYEYYSTCPALCTECISSIKFLPTTTYPPVAAVGRAVTFQGSRKSLDLESSELALVRLCLSVPFCNSFGFGFIPRAVAFARASARVDEIKLLHLEYGPNTIINHHADPVRLYHLRF
ncbi:hypothetical protein EVAR_13860_1 [Eumeta japonica]|uniref:Uncharacterized protein n=1 Tax=Eumeta variegata TaxID=151549 RepID=A0A4C1U1H8_EUMVA|nr:hypothetical protein EVAR_13860_1 [Eumeta japonica]